MTSAELSRMKQQLRNRISAQISRDKKKEYVTTLEAKNEELIIENSNLLHKLKQYES